MKDIGGWFVGEKLLSMLRWQEHETCGVRTCESSDATDDCSWGMESWCTLGLSFCLTWRQITFGNVQVDTHHIRESSKVLFVVSSPERALNPMSAILNTVFWSSSWWFEVISGAFPTRLEPHFGHLTGLGGFVHWMPPPIHHEGRLDTVCLEPSHINFGFLNNQSG